MGNVTGASLGPFDRDDLEEVVWNEVSALALEGEHGEAAATEIVLVIEMPTRVDVVELPPGVADGVDL